MGEAYRPLIWFYTDPTDILSGFQMGRLRCVEGEGQGYWTETTQVTHDVTRGSRTHTPKRKPREELNQGAAEFTGKGKTHWILPCLRKLVVRAVYHTPRTAVSRGRTGSQLHQSLLVPPWKSKETAPHICKEQMHALTMLGMRELVSHLRRLCHPWEGGYRRKGLWQDKWKNHFAKGFPSPKVNS